MSNDAQLFSKEGFIEVPNGKVWYGIAGEKTDKAPLVTLHGGPAFPSDYLWPLSKLADERQIIFYDQLGCGRSDRTTDPALWHIDHFVEELKIVREALGLSEMHLFGHSWGTMLATDYLLTQPTGVRSVLYASSAISNPLWMKTVATYLENLPEGLGDLIRSHEENGLIDVPEYIEAVRRYRLTHEQRLPIEPASYSASLAGMNDDQYYYMCGPSEYNPVGSMKEYDQTGRLHEIEVSALFTCGAYDGSDPETNAYYASLMKNAEVAVFPESSHVPHLEEEDDYIHTLRSFLARHD